MDDQIEAHAALANQKLGFMGQADGLPAIPIDSIPPLGDGEGYTPLDLVLISLAACAGSTIVSLLRKMRKTVARCNADATGVKREEHPRIFESITLCFLVVSPDAEGADIEKAIELSEKKYCPVWAMLKGNVSIQTKYKLSRE